MKVEIELLVSDVSIEEKTFTDRVTGQSRTYTSCRLSGITSDMTTPCILRVPEALKPQLERVNKGETILVSLRSLDLGKGICEGVVSELFRKE